MKLFSKCKVQKYIKKTITTDALSCYYTHNRVKTI